MDINWSSPEKIKPLDVNFVPTWINLVNGRVRLNSRTQFLCKKVYLHYVVTSFYKSTEFMN